MDLTAIFIKLLLTDPEQGLESWSNIKKSYLQGFDSVILAIGSYYNKHGAIPNFSELEVSNRNMSVNTSISILKDVEVPEDVSIEIVADALLDTYTQNNVLESLDKLLDNITLMDSHEIKEEIASISINLEEQTHSSADVYNMHDMTIITSPEERGAVVKLLFSEEFDIHSGGMEETNLILLGGHRGSGKSICCANIAVLQYLAGYAGVMFTIEMSSNETFHRYLSILSGVSHRDIKNATLTPVQLLKLAKARTEMFVDGTDALDDYKEHDNFNKLEKDLQGYKLKKDNQLMIIENPEISLTQIDLHLYKLKARFGANFKVACVDYLNVINIGEGGQFEWQSQLELARGLKKLASKHNILIVSPLQTKEDGGIKYSKDILVPADLVLNMTATEDTMQFEPIKTRDMSPLKFEVGIKWDTVTINPAARGLTEAKIESKELPDKAKDDL